MKEHEASRHDSGAALKRRSGRPPAVPETAPSITPRHPELADWLNRLLADEFVLYTKALNDHWNIRGMQFHSLHDFFESLYKTSLKIADDVAERVRTVGGIALGTLDDFLKHTRLEEQPGFPPDPRGMIHNLLADHEAIIETLKEGVKATAERFDDPGTNNFLADLLEKHEKLAWMLRVHLDTDLG